MNLPVVLYIVKIAHRHRANGVARPGQTPFGFPACSGPTGSCFQTAEGRAARGLGQCRGLL